MNSPALLFQTNKLPVVPRRFLAGMTYRGLLCLGLILLSAAVVSPAEPQKPLWEIGKADGENREFALAPSAHQQFQEDGLFVVGESDSRRDWPYVHPGPADAWAGGRQHTFSILFGLKRSVTSGQCRLQVRLLDTHSLVPPELRIDVNGQAFQRSMPVGAGDASVQGQPGKGRPYAFTVEFPASLLKSGDNEIHLTTVSGSWLLYDWLALEAPAGAELTRIQSRTVVQRVQPVAALLESKGEALQPVYVTLRHIGEPIGGSMQFDGFAPVHFQLTNGVQAVELTAPAVAAETRRHLKIQAGSESLPAQEVTFKPVRKLTIYVLPHSHTDIGYTEIQTAIEQKQVKNLLQGIAAARRTASYPDGARFVWNVEVLWAADLYLHRLNQEQRDDFFDAVKKGQVALNGMYLNELTGLCRPEELLQLFRYATELGQRCGTPIDSAMISDVPGYTWGTVSAMAQAGIKYFSAAPNYFDRIGDILVAWENKPFYWVSPSGREKVLFWIPFKGYALSHLHPALTPEFVGAYEAELEKRGYPYDISYMRWSGHGDNAAPDPAICEFIKDWNTKYSYPKFIISSTSRAFHDFEQRYGQQLPEFRGDLTPYWEDGAGSSALETSMNRATAERLTQAETLWAMLAPAAYPAEAFDQAWKNVLLYSEHTWGASMSVSDPECQMTKEQWAIKQSYALSADRQSRQLLEQALAFPSKVSDNAPAGSSSTNLVIDVFNTTSWPRTELVQLNLATPGDSVTDAQGQPVCSQRLSSGELAFVARQVPPFGVRRFQVTPGPASNPDGIRASASSSPAGLQNGLLQLRLDPQGGGIVELRAKGMSANLAENSSGHTLNEYLFLPGNDLVNLQSNGPVTITVKEPGPLVASLRVESSAPGCQRLTREVRLIAGFDFVELFNTVDKTRAAIPTHAPDWQFAQKGGKESVNFAFPFNVPGGEVSLDIPLGALRPEVDQLPGSCKNWFTVGRWVEVANKEYGVTWVTLDAPLVEVGAISATLIGSQGDPAVWRKHVAPTQTIYSWAMNNHWSTNYRGYQDGPVRFRFVLRPHPASAPDEATRFATGFSQPLVARRAQSKSISTGRLRVTPESVVVLAMKPSDDGKAIMVRLFEASGHPARATLTWNDVRSEQFYLSDSSERALQKVKGPEITLSAWGIETVRAELPSGPSDNNRASRTEARAPRGW